MTKLQIMLRGGGIILVVGVVGEIWKSTEKENCVTTASKNIVDFEVGDAAIDDTLLSQLPSQLLKSFNFSNCNNCHFAFNVHIHQK